MLSRAWSGKCETYSSATISGGESCSTTVGRGCLTSNGVPAWSFFAALLLDVGCFASYSSNMSLQRLSSSVRAVH
eukprot:scaffold59354_cov84-Phaeocystis_antarctica.AAC.1